MRTPFLALAMLLGTAGASHAQQDIDRLAWMAGCWRADGAEPGSVEQWTAPAGGTMLGMSRTVRGGRTAEFEFMQLRHLADGTLAFVPQPAGRPPTVFRLLRLTQAEVVFENPEHDFPQRIGYARDGETRLLAHIEGQRGGTPRRIDFVFVRTACDGPPVTPSR